MNEQYEEWRQNEKQIYLMMFFRMSIGKFHSIWEENFLVLKERR